MNGTEARTLFDYNAWANGRVLEQASLLSEEQYTAPAGLSFSSVRGTLVHILGAEWMWRKRVEEGISPSRIIPETDLPTYADLVLRWKNEADAWQGYLAELADAELKNVVRYTDTQGRSFETPQWQILLHVVNHGTQFRSEAAVALTQAGHSPGNLDLIAYLRMKG